MQPSPARRFRTGLGHTTIGRPIRLRVMNEPFARSLDQTASSLGLTYWLHCTNFCCYDKFHRHPATINRG